ncbi:MAG: hypothetical protein KAS88_00405, partial [Deltaproteobacteria bacterium]|nr:hypothetical protein [Deltaproteobacteria bacterium]
MAESKMYLAVGEESTRGVKEVATVGFIPLLSPSIPKMEFDEIRRTEMRGTSGVMGDTSVTRMSRKWGASMEMPFFTEAGGSKPMVGTILKHFFGSAVSAQQGTTNAYAHMIYPVADPFS